MLLMHSFFALHIHILGPLQKTDLINSNVHGSGYNLVTSEVSLCSGTGIFKTYPFFMLLHAIIGNTKMSFSKSFTEVFKRQNDIMQ